MVKPYDAPIQVSQYRKFKKTRIRIKKSIFNQIIKIKHMTRNITK